jgi:hypothetical protein
MGRATNKLSVKFIEKSDLRPGLYGDGNGLYLQVSNRRTKAWVFRFMMAGRARKMGLGDVERVNLKDARKKANVAHGLVVDGVDPIEHRNAKKAAQAIEKAKLLTFKEATERYIEAHQAGWKSAKHGAQAADGGLGRILQRRTAMKAIEREICRALFVLHQLKLGPSLLPARLKKKRLAKVHELETRALKYLAGKATWEDPAELLVSLDDEVKGVAAEIPKKHVRPGNPGKTKALTGDLWVLEEHNKKGRSIPDLVREACRTDKLNPDMKDSRHCRRIHRLSKNPRVTNRGP